MCTNRGIIFTVLALCGWLGMTSTGTADFITGVTATAGSEPFGSLPAENLTNGSGMTPGSPVTKDSTADNAPGGVTMWLGDSSSNWVLFTFANNTPLQEMVIWNYNQNNEAAGPGTKLWERGLQDVTITYSTGDNASGEGHELFSGKLNCATGSSAQSYTNDIVLSTPALDVKAVKIVYTSNWGSEPYYGLSEVRFNAAVPEPASLVSLTIGLIGLLAYAWRKKR